MPPDFCPGQCSMINSVIDYLLRVNVALDSSIGIKGVIFAFPVVNFAELFGDKSEPSIIRLHLKILIISFVR